MVGVLTFSLTLPATLLGVKYFDPVFMVLGRAVIGGLIAVTVFLSRRERLFPPGHLKTFIVVALCIVIAFPFFIALALRHVPASHAAVVIGILPLATAIAGAFFLREKHGAVFWLSAFFGSATVVAFSLWRNTGRLSLDDIYLLCAVLATAVGYAEGGRLAKIYGGAKVISYCLVLALPVLVIPTALLFRTAYFVAPFSAVAGLIYTGVFSVYLGFFAWYKGLALAGIGKVGQTQLLQPFLTMLFSAWIFSENIDTAMLVVALLVAISIFTGRLRFSPAVFFRDKTKKPSASRSASPEHSRR